MFGVVIALVCDHYFVAGWAVIANPDNFLD